VSTVDGTFTDNDCSNGDWELEATLSEGDNTITVTANDPYSNSAIDFITIALDTTAPTVTLTAPPNISLLNQYTYTVTGTCSEEGRDVSVPNYHRRSDVCI